MILNFSADQLGIFCHNIFFRFFEIDVCHYLIELLSLYTRSAFVIKKGLQDFDQTILFLFPHWTDEFGQNLPILIHNFIYEPIEIFVYNFFDIQFRRNLFATQPNILHIRLSLVKSGFQVNLSLVWEFLVQRGLRKLLKIFFEVKYVFLLINRNFELLHLYESFLTNHE